MSLRFRNNFTEKNIFCKYKSQFYINKVGIEKIVVHKKFYCGENSFKYFIPFRYCKKVIPLCTNLPWMSEYVKSFSENKCISFLIEGF